LAHYPETLSFGAQWTIKTTVKKSGQPLLMKINKNHDDIYSAVIITEVIVRVHSVHLVNVEQHQVAADPQTKPSDLGCKSA